MARRRIRKDRLRELVGENNRGFAKEIALAQLGGQRPSQGQIETARRLLLKHLDDKGDSKVIAMDVKLAGIYAEILGVPQDEFLEPPPPTKDEELSSLRAKAAALEEELRLLREEREAGRGDDAFGPRSQEASR